MNGKSRKLFKTAIQKMYYTGAKISYIVSFPCFLREKLFGWGNIKRETCILII
jgi:hypothetical protein